MPTLLITSNIGYHLSDSVDSFELLAERPFKHFAPLRSKANMQHSLTAEGFGIRLRPVVMGDAAFIVWLRNLEGSIGRVGDSATTVQEQQAWLEVYFSRPQDYYFIVESNRGLPIGTYGIYDVKQNSAELGRWIIRPSVPAAIPSAILVHDLAFKRMNLESLRGTVVASNLRVRSVNRKLGYKELNIVPNAQVIGGRLVDIVHHLMTPTSWNKSRSPLMPLAEYAQTRIELWEQTSQS